MASPILQLGPEVRTHPKQICEDAASGHRGSGAGPLHNQRVSVVPARDEADDVVGEVDVGERVRAIEFDETNRRT
jgi:hypothetical protein